MRLFAQAAEIPEIFDAPAQLPNWAIAALGGLVLLAIAGFVIYRQRRQTRDSRPPSRLSPEA